MGRWGPILPFMLSPHEASVSTLFSGVLDIAGVYWPLEEVVVGAAGHGPVLLLVQSVGTIGSAWDPVECVWVRPGLLMLCHLAPPISVFQKCCSGCLECQGCTKLELVFGVGVSLR